MRKGSLLIVVLALSAVAAVAAWAAQRPQAVSPGSPLRMAGVSGACPTFNWSTVSGATGYDLVVYRVEDGKTPSPSVAGEGGESPALRVSLPASASGWTPSIDQCFEPGERYAWSVRANARRGASEWSAPSLFEIATAPSVGEVERALAVLRRFVTTGETPVGTVADGNAQAAAGVSELPALSARSANPNALRVRRQQHVANVGAPPVLLAPTVGASPSLSVDNQVHLGADSVIVKDGSLFIWDLETGPVVTPYFYKTTAVGRNALSATNSFAAYNTAVGFNALKASTQGSSNTAVGSQALATTTTGGYNTAVGDYALGKTAPGALNNTAIGAQALGDPLGGSTFTGSNNVAIGALAGHLSTTASNSIFIGNFGASGDTDVIRIGGIYPQTVQSEAFISGIRGTTTGNNNAIAVLIDSDGQLGTASSSEAVKQDIETLEAEVERLLALRPVKFRYKKHAVQGDATVQFGLIAEEVAEVFPELVIFDAEGKPETVKYHLLSSLLLGEIKRQAAEIESQADRLTRLEALEAEVAALRRAVR